MKTKEQKRREAAQRLLERARRIRDRELKWVNWRLFTGAESNKWGDKVEAEARRLLEM